MNRFLTRKKTHDGAAEQPKKQKKGKKGAQMDAPPVLDLSSALPSTDDFRTSLIMPTLSTRFSMLREQDDPNSKLGKASDDSVLSPKRQSRLYDFGFRPTGLSDIAEVSSLNGSIRATESGRQGSVTDESQDGGSIMSRARPGEGNVLFGGRQKIYMIPSGSKSSLGRALYDDDVNLSAFQKIKKQEREEALSREKADAEKQESEELGYSKEAAYSPAVSSFSKRETGSSTGSGPSISRSSTAATSVASQGSNTAASSPTPAVSSGPSYGGAPTVERSVTKTRRLYEQGLNQHIHDQQNSALNRLNSIQRGQGSILDSRTPLYQTKSASNLNDRFNRTGQQFRAASPPPTSPSNHINAFSSNKEMNSLNSLNSSPVVSHPSSPPLSPVGTESEDLTPLESALRPADRGKATALGAFNKPKQYDEKQYVQRLQMQQNGRETPELRRDAPSRKQSDAALQSNDSPVSEVTPSSRPRSPSATPSLSRARSPSDASSVRNGFSVFQRAANQIRAGTIGTSGTSIESPSTAGASDHQRTFFASPDDSEDEIDRKARPIAKADLQRKLQSLRHPSPSPHRPPPPLHEHPALRSYNSQTQLNQPETVIEDPSREAAAQGVQNDRQQTQAGAIHEEEVDSPTLGPDNGGLSGLVRQHLRNVSNVSSVYTDAAPPEPLVIRTREGTKRSDADTPAHSSYTHSNPWDLEDFEGGYYGEADSFSSTSPVDPLHTKTQSSNFGKSSFDQDYRTNSLSQGPDSKDPSVWEQQVPSSRASTDTQRERIAIKREMSRRRRAIEEKMSVAADDDEQAAAQLGGGQGARRALTLLRSKASRDSMAGGSKSESATPPVKALKMLGLGIAKSPDNGLMNENPKTESPSPREERSGPFRPRPRPSRQDYYKERREPEQQYQRPGPPQHRPRTDTSVSREGSRPPTGRTPPGSSKSSIRDRSGSEASSGRSRSRTGRYRDDLDKAMAEGTGASTGVHMPTAPLPDQSPMRPPQGFVGARPTTEYTSQQADGANRTRGRANSKSQGPAYFDQKGLQPIQTNYAQLPVPSPRIPGGFHSANGTPLHSPAPVFSPSLPPSPRPSPGPHSPAVFVPRASPMGTNFSAASTPPISNVSTPVQGTFGASTTSLPSSAVTARDRSASMPRKKSVNKNDISEPMLLSSTSRIGTVDLPVGVSLKNGMEMPPPLPPINPRRRMFGFGRSESSSQESSSQTSVQPPQPPYLTQRTHSGDEIDKRSKPRQRLRKTSSEGHSLRGQANAQAAAPSPAVPHIDYSAINTSPPRPTPTAEGVMF
jgi:hypothetical protein